MKKFLPVVLITTVLLIFLHVNSLAKIGDIKTERVSETRRLLVQEVGVKKETTLINGKQETKFITIKKELGFIFIDSGYIINWGDYLIKAYWQCRVINQKQVIVSKIKNEVVANFWKGWLPYEIKTGKSLIAWKMGSGNIKLYEQPAKKITKSRGLMFFMVFWLVGLVGVLVRLKFVGLPTITYVLIAIAGFFIICEIGFSIHTVLRITAFIIDFVAGIIAAIACVGFIADEDNNAIIVNELMLVVLILYLISFLMLF